MDEMQTVEVRFRGEMLATHVDGADVYTVYRTEGLYRVHIDEGEGAPAWLEGGHLGSGLTVAQLRTLFPELFAAAGLET